MTDQQTPVSRSLRKWILLSAFIGYLALFVYLLYYIGLHTLLNELSKVNLWIYLLAIGSLIGSITLHALVWFRLLGYLKINLGFRRTFTLYWVGIFVDNLIPGGWSGDLFKAYLLGRDRNLDAGAAVASVVAKNLYEALFNIGNMVLGVVLLFFNYSLAGSIFIGIGVIMFLMTLPLVILIIISIKPQASKRALNQIILRIAALTKNRVNLSKHQEGLNKLLDDYHSGMRLLVSDLKIFIKPMIVSFFAWGLEVLALYLVFASLGAFFAVDKVIIVRSIASNVEAQGYAFAGYAQIITTALYTTLGVLPALAASVGLLGGVVIFWLKTSISYVSFHCVVFASCANYACNLVRGHRPRECQEGITTPATTPLPLSAKKEDQPQTRS